MAQQIQQPSVSELFQLSLTCSSKNTGQDTSGADGAVFDDGFVFNIDPTLLLDRHKLSIDHIIGEGSHSIVYDGRYEFHPVAIKAILPGRTKDASPDCKARFQREVNLLSKVKHKNIVKFLGASVEPTMVIVTELLEGGSLLKNLKRIYPMTLDYEQCLSFALEISQAMEHLHAKGFIHRDLKPSNLLLTKDKKHVKVADFGIAREEMCDGMTSEAGTYRYMAPELFSKSPLRKGAKKCYDRKADVYSFAMVLWSLVKNETPFKDRKDLMAAYAAANNMRPSLDEFPGCLVPLVKSCWEEDPKLRPEFKEITTTLTTLLRVCRSTGTIALTRIAESDEELESNTDGQSSKAKGPTSQQSMENISNRRTIKPNGLIDVKGESLSQRKTKTPKWNNIKLKCLSFFKLCFGI
ncbi:hypothetical protein TanjilG_12991 [Lupinus angustifolius]|uniref:Protein kinase domain-containing protein n=1 Tax=Lupinus angustifolius TaxID=3871 RepID=A0A1J7H309_LUPAN|nr:PREDICTED: serine/threonine-protein kinase HT1-like [Lupinus angustifolius]OIV94778.1 hypothetical protein TanjilG_12991 [Lupinus angustifolius]